MKKTFLILLVLVSIMLFGCDAEGAHKGSSESASVNQSEPEEQNLIDIDKIDFKGMTYGEVKEIMGSEGKDVGSGAAIFQWELDDGRVLNVWLGNRDLHDTLDEYYVISFRLEKETVIESETFDNTQPENSSYVFYSFDDLKKAFSNDISDSEVADIRNNWDKSSESYKTFVNGVENNEVKLKYPILSGDYNTSLTSYIILFTSELYEFSWIWYRGEIEGTRIIVQISYVNEDILNYSREHTMSETVRYIAPTAPNVDNYQSYPSYVSIVEKTVDTDNGAVSALVSTTSAGDMIIQYVFDDMLVLVQGASSVINEEIIKDIDFITSNDSHIDK